MHDQLQSLLDRAESLRVDIDDLRTTLSDGTEITATRVPTLRGELDKAAESTQDTCDFLTDAMDTDEGAV